MPRRNLRNYWSILLFVIPFVFFYFGLDSLFYRIEVRSTAIPIVAQVASSEIKSYSCKDSDGNRRTCRSVAYELTFEMNGDRFERPLLDGNFDPGDTWHSLDMIPPDEYPVGADMAVLVRPDLGFLIAIDSFWSAYVLPIVLLGFGTFWFLATLFIVPAILREDLGLRRSRKGDTP